VKYSSDLIQSVGLDEDSVIEEIIELMKKSSSFQYAYKRKNADGSIFHIRCLIEIFEKFTISIILEAKFVN
jgi:hypothetical protein